MIRKRWKQITNDLIGKSSKIFEPVHNERETRTITPQLKTKFPYQVWTRKKSHSNSIKTA